MKLQEPRDFPSLAEDSAIGWRHMMSSGSGVWSHVTVSSRWPKRGNKENVDIC